jgi:CRP-like cAMP-binding protein
MTNALLAALAPDDRMALMAVGQKRAFLRGQAIGHADSPINAVLFIEKGSVAATVPMGNGDAVEAFTIGDEGVTGGWAGQTRGAWRLVTRSDVGGLAVDIRDLTAVVERRAGVRQVLLDYGVRLSVELAQNAACNLCHRTEERLAKWLLRQHDREGAVPVRETVIGLAQILGVQRKAARAAVEGLRKDGLVDSGRGALAVTDRDGLEARACDCYDPARSVRDDRRASMAQARLKSALG